MKMVYICSPCRGDYEQNINNAKEYCLAAIREGLLPIAPHVYFTQFLDDTNPKERQQGMNCGLQLLAHCQKIRVFGDKLSAGMYWEIRMAGAIGLKIEVCGSLRFEAMVMSVYHDKNDIDTDETEKIINDLEKAYHLGDFETP